MKPKFTIEHPMPPLWIMYPNITQYSMGWRMGYGEGYKWELSDWLKTLTEEEKKEYDLMFPKPIFWQKDNEDNYYDFIAFWQKNGEMKYSIGELIAQNTFATQESIFFWKPSPNCFDKSCLGQWQSSLFEVDIDTFTCAEQYIMVEKARLFKDKQIEEQIRQSSDPKEMKALGKKVKNFNQTIWDKVKYSIVLNGNYYKFSQNKPMRDFLLSTGNKILVEASPLDTIWGIGLKDDNPKANTPTMWRGKNLLGFALMEVRGELRRLYENYDKIDWDK